MALKIKTFMGIFPSAHLQGVGWKPLHANVFSCASTNQERSLKVQTVYLPPKYKYKQNRFGKADNCRTEHLHHNQLVFPCNKQTAVQYFCYLVRQLTISVMGINFLVNNLGITKQRMRNGSDQDIHLYFRSWLYVLKFALPQYVEFEEVWRAWEKTWQADYHQMVWAGFSISLSVLISFLYVSFWGFLDK